MKTARASKPLVSGRPNLFAVPTGASRISRSGAAATELALVLPVLILFVGGIVEYGRAIYSQIVLANAVRVGSEAGATWRCPPSGQTAWNNRITTACKAEAASIPGFAEDRIDVRIETRNDFAGRLQVTVSGDYELRTLLTWPGLPRTIALSHSVTMRQYQ